jgi:hypothetical protein
MYRLQVSFFHSNVASVQVISLDCWTSFAILSQPASLALKYIVRMSIFQKDGALARRIIREPMLPTSRTRPAYPSHFFLIKVLSMGQIELYTSATKAIGYVGLLNLLIRDMHLPAFRQSQVFVPVLRWLFPPKQEPVTSGRDANWYRNPYTRREHGHECVSGKCRTCKLLPSRHKNAIVNTLARRDQQVECTRVSAHERS